MKTFYLQNYRANQMHAKTCTHFKERNAFSKENAISITECPSTAFLPDNVVQRLSNGTMYLDVVFLKKNIWRTGIANILSIFLIVAIFIFLAFIGPRSWSRSDLLYIFLITGSFGSILFSICLFCPFRHFFKGIYFNLNTRKCIFREKGDRSQIALEYDDRAKEVKLWGFFSYIKTINV